MTTANCADSEPMAALPGPAPRRALVIALRYIGDVLLSTPVAHTLKRLHPDCAIDMLVFHGSEPMLEGNPHLRAVVTTREGASLRERIAQMRALWRRYDLSVVTAPGDPPVLFGLAAARMRVGFVPSQGSTRFWKRRLLTRSCDFDPLAPRMTQNDQLARLLGAPRADAIVAPSAAVAVASWRARLGFDPGEQRFAVIHAAPRWRYKRWSDRGWQALAEHLVGRGLRVVLTGGPGAEERRYLDDLVATGLQGQRVDGQLSLAETADLLRLAHLYVGPDTATTHLAAACGTPTLALFGPTDPVIWGPTPRSDQRDRYQRVAPLQRRGNVLLVQNPNLDFVPCQQECCERHRESRSDCLDQLAADRVVNAVEDLLNQPASLAG